MSAPSSEGPIAIDVGKPIGRRISEMTLIRTGRPIDPDRNYVVSGWASVNEGTQGPPVYDVVSAHIERNKVVSVPENRDVTVRGAG